MERIYLDNAATTKPYQEVLDTMSSWVTNNYGNPMSIYSEGRVARNSIDEARELISDVLGCEFSELIFTGSGTEAANLAIIGLALQNEEKRRDTIFFNSTEHECVLNTKHILTKLGYKIQLIPVTKAGLVDLDWLNSNICDNVLLVSTMHANNETGVVNNINSISEIGETMGVIHHVDAVQTFLNPIDNGSLWNVNSVRAHLINVSAHKIHGPKGVGALYIRRGIKLKSFVSGGEQERSLRAGTENTAAITGFAKAVQISHDNYLDFYENKKIAKKVFWDQLKKHSPVDIEETVPKDEVQVLGGHLHLRFKGVSAESLLILMDRAGISASSGSACGAGSMETSHVLKAMGLSQEFAKETIRFTFGSDTPKEKAIVAADKLIEILIRFK